jgi:hypothetical protein
MTSLTMPNGSPSAKYSIAIQASWRRSGMDADSSCSAPNSQMGDEINIARRH